jgi:hypothetical protein
MVEAFHARSHFAKTNGRQTRLDGPSDQTYASREEFDFADEVAALVHNLPTEAEAR